MSNKISLSREGGGDSFDPGAMGAKSGMILEGPLHFPGFSH